ncbi:MAG: hypothetical protein ABFD89_23805 [Bryobacteraceae bacterium]
MGKENSGSGLPPKEGSGLPPKQELGLPPGNEAAKEGTTTVIIGNISDAQMALAAQAKNPLRTIDDYDEYVTQASEDSGLPPSLPRSVAVGDGRMETVSYRWVNMDRLSEDPLRDFLVPVTRETAPKVPEAHFNRSKGLITKGVLVLCMISKKVEAQYVERSRALTGEQMMAVQRGQAGPEGGTSIKGVTTEQLINPMSKAESRL